MDGKVQDCQFRQPMGICTESERIIYMSMMEYARSFELTMKESVKRVTQWAAFYHASRKS